MKAMTKYVVLVAIFLLSSTASGQARKPSVSPATAGHLPSLTAKPTHRPLVAADEVRLKAMIAQHQRVRSQLPAKHRAELDQLTQLVKNQLFAAPIQADMLASAAQIVSKIVPDLTQPEATALAEYVLGRIAGGDVIGSTVGRSVGSMNTTKSAPATQETQMRFNMQYLQLQSQMQSENRSYTAVSNIMKTKHETIKNSIDNVR